MPEVRGSALRIAAKVVLLLCWTVGLVGVLNGDGKLVSPVAVEVLFTRGVYPEWVRTVAYAFSLLPFSVATVALFLLPPVLVCVWVVQWRRKRQRGEGRWPGLTAGLSTVFWSGGVLLCIFYGFWGFGYGRLTVEKRLNLDMRAPPAEEAEQVLDRVYRVLVDNLPTAQERDVERALQAIASEMEKVVEEWEGLEISLPRRVKRTLPGFLLSGGTAGICVPFTLEPHIDGALPAVAQVYVGAHELGHLAGYCVEAEASLIGYVAGLRAGDRFARYSVALDLYRDLASIFGAKERERFMARLPEEARADLKAVQESYRRYQIRKYAKLSAKVYDRYLKAQGIAEGRLNYGRSVNLFLAVYRKGLVRWDADPRETFPDLPLLPYPSEREKNEEGTGTSEPSAPGDVMPHSSPSSVPDAPRVDYVTRGHSVHFVGNEGCAWVGCAG